MAGLVDNVVTLLGTGLGTAARRLTRGPLRPGWDWKYEATVAFLRATNARMAGEEPARQRAIMDSVTLPSAALRRVRREAVRAGGVPAMWFIPPDARDEVVLYLHGGAYVFGSLRTHADLMARLALASGARVLGLDYRLAPEHPFPAALEDAVAAWRWLLASGVSPRQAVLAGDSAGGGLSLTTMLALRGRGEPQPAGGVLVAPWVDLTCSLPVPAAHAQADWIDARQAKRWAGWYLGGADARDPLASPLHADLQGLPPLYVQLGGAELLHTEVTRFAERAREAGVRVELDVWPEMVHDFVTFGPDFPECARATERLGERVRAFTSAPAPEQQRPAVARVASTG